MPLRIWDSFVPPTDNWALAVTYAVDNGASVAEGAIGGLTNTRFARSAVRYADNRGMSLMLVSSDINSANHNYPTNYDEAVYVAGSFPDTAPNNTCTGPGGLPGIGDVFPDPPTSFQAGCQQFLDALGTIGVTPTAQPFTTSFFRNSNLTQYGGKADIVLMGSTGSENTGQAAGVAGLLESYARTVFAGSGLPAGLRGNETRQLLTMTAEDVLPANTGVIGQPDKANTGWDSHFGYGRVNMAAAMARIQLRPGQPIPAGWRCGTRRTCIPPEAQLDAPDWFSPINVARVPASGLQVRGRAAAPHAGDVGAWVLQYACGQDAADSSFQNVPGANGTGPVNGVLGTLSKSLLTSLADNCNGEVANDAGRPAGAAADGAWPADPYPNPDPERHAFQIRLTVREAANPANFGRYRKTLFAYRDDGNLAGWPKPLGPGASAAAHVTGSGGETAPRLYDVDGDNKLDVLLATSSGELYALHHDGTPVQSFNGGNPVITNRMRLEQSHPIDASLPAPRESLRVPGDRRRRRRSRGGDRRHRGRAPLRLEPERHTLAGLPGAHQSVVLRSLQPRRSPSVLRRLRPSAHGAKPSQARLPRLTGARRSHRRSAARHRRGGARPAPLRLGRQRRPAARVPGEAVDARRGAAPRSSPRPRSPSSTGNSHARWSSPRTRSSRATPSRRGQSSTSSTPSSARPPAPIPCMR